MELKYWVWLFLVLGPYNKKSIEVMEAFSDLEKAYKNISKGENSLLSESENRRAKTLPLEKAEKLINECEKDEIHIITFESEFYPTSLRNIYNQPLILFAKGNIEVLKNTLMITVVGSRNPSAYSIKAGKRICTELAKIGFIIVSGMALGLDSVAHESAVNTKSPTIAVLACGLKCNYPNTSYPLRSRIIQTGGVVISELLPNSTVPANYFLERNRLMSGLSLGTFIVQAGHRSGCTLTAEHAIDQGRDLFCLVPHDIFDGSYGGVVKYLRDGAIPVFSHLDIVYNYYTSHSHVINPEFLNNVYSKKPKKTESVIFAMNKMSDGIIEKKVSNTDEETAQKQEVEIPWDELDESCTLIVKSLQEKEMPAEEIAEKTNLDLSEVFELMVELEMMQIVENDSGGVYKIK